MRSSLQCEPACAGREGTVRSEPSDGTNRMKRDRMKGREGEGGKEEEDWGRRRGKRTERRTTSIRHQSFSKPAKGSSHQGRA